MQIDDTDRRLLRQWQAEPALTVQALAGRAGLSTATARRRVDRLRKAGVLRGPAPRIDWRALGYGVAVSLRITLDKSDPRAFDAFLAEARQVPEVTEIQTFLGRVDIRLAVIARDMEHYQQIYTARILSLPHIADIEGLVDVSDVKIDARLPL